MVPEVAFFDDFPSFLERGIPSPTRLIFIRFAAEAIQELPLVLRIEAGVEARLLESMGVVTDCLDESVGCMYRGEFLAAEGFSLRV